MLQRLCASEAQVFDSLLCRVELTPTIVEIDATALRYQNFETRQEEEDPP